MRVMVILLALLPAAATSLPAAAQSVVGPGADASLSQAREGIREGRRSGQLTGREARDLRRQIGQVSDLAERQAIGGTTDSERRFAESAAAATSGLVEARRYGGPR